jgi:hypothetical protein
MGKMQSATATAAIVVCIVDGFPRKPKLGKNRLSRCCSAVAMAEAQCKCNVTTFPTASFGFDSISSNNHKVDVAKNT